MAMARNTVPRPFLKWVGGKGSLLPELRARIALSPGFHRYHEPFVGGGALFFDLYRDKVLGRPKAYLSDNNLNLIEAYRGIRDYLDSVIELLREHKARHGKEHYYAVRGQVPEDLPARAARVLYLNRTCFNGLYRENSKGEFNVPMGRYVNPVICDEANLRAVAEALKRADIGVRHFSEVLKHAQPGDLVYFDPPYHPVSKTAYFTAYDKNAFGAEDQRELARVFAQLSKNGVHALLSNSMTPFIRDLYRGFKIESVYAPRNVNSNAAARGKVAEALVRNF